MTIEYTDIGYLKSEQDATDLAQDDAIALKAAVSSVYTKTEQDLTDANQDALITSKAPITMNTRSYFDSVNKILYTTDDGSDPQP